MNIQKEPFLPYGKQNINSSDIEAVVAVLQSDQITQGPLINKFEQSIAREVKVNFSVAVNSATSALHIACLALGLGPGDWLWTSPITFVASANCGIYCGAKVDFVDINPKTGLMSIEALKEKLKLADKNGKLPKILIPVHLAGSSCEMEAISELSEKYGFLIIEDASHAIGGYYQQEPVGNCKYSSISIFSFHPVKIITTGEGGAATTNDSYLYEKMQMLRSHGITKDKTRFEILPSEEWSYEQQMIGFNYRITDIQCALGISQIKRLKEVVYKRNQLLDIYKYFLSNMEVSLLDIPKDVKSSVHLAIIRLNQQTKNHHREVFKLLREQGIGVQVHYNPVHLQPFYRKMGFKPGDYEYAEEYSNNAISLPLFPELEEKDIRRVVNALGKALNL